MKTIYHSMLPTSYFQQKLFKSSLIRLFTIWILSPLATQAADVSELADMNLEELLAVKIITASKYQQDSSDNAGVVSVIDSQQIKHFGYRTVGDALRSVPGFFISNNRMYENVGIRGFDQSDSFNGRMLVMIDGNRINEPVYDSGFVGNELPLDVDLIDRIEVVRGPGSSMYGNNAFFAVVNIITKHGKQFQGSELAGSWGSFETFKGRASYGRKLDNGLEYLLSATTSNSEGPTLKFPDAATSSNPLGRDFQGNRDHTRKFFAKASWGDFSFVGGYGQRKRGLPGGTFGTNFADPDNRYLDGEAFVNLQYQKQIFPHLDFSGRAFYGSYDYQGYFRFGDVTLTAPLQAWWTGFDLQAVSTYFDKHTIVAGIDVQENWQQKQTLSYQGMTPYFHDERDTHRIGVYLQDDFHITDQLLLSLGARFDDHSLISEALFSPRLGLVYRPFADTLIKIQYGQAFRAPNVIQQFQQYSPTFGPNNTLIAPGQLANRSLRAEQVDTYQLSFEQGFLDHWRFVATGYLMEINKRFGQVSADPTNENNQYHNLGGEIGYGAEFELQGRWQDGTLLRTAYSYAQEKDLDGDEDGDLLNSVASHLYQLNVMTPLFNPQWRGGLELQMLSDREFNQSKVKGYTRVNLSLLYQPIKKLDVSATVYDVFNDHLREPGGVLGIPQEGRSFRLKIDYRF